MRTYSSHSREYCEKALIDQTLSRAPKSALNDEISCFYGFSTIHIRVQELFLVVKEYISCVELSYPRHSVVNCSIPSLPSKTWSNGEETF